MIKTIIMLKILRIMIKTLVNKKNIQNNNFLNFIKIYKLEKNLMPNK